MCMMTGSYSSGRDDVLVYCAHAACNEAKASHYSGESSLLYVCIRRRTFYFINFYSGSAVA